MLKDQVDLNIDEVEPQELSDIDELTQSSSHASKLSSTGSIDGSEILAQHNREAVNKVMSALNISPVSKKKMKEKDYPNQKVKQVADAVKNKLNIDEPESDENSELMKNIKEAFAAANKYEKYQLLTLLPTTWSLRKMQAEFGITMHIA